MDLQVQIVTHEDRNVGPRNPKQMKDYLNQNVESEDEESQEYEALSYHWGLGGAYKPVYLYGEEHIYAPEVGVGEAASFHRLVPDYHKGRRFYVRSNLDQALRYLRHKSETVILWVDAICINQEDEKGEKPEQIAKMKDIYNKAERVCIWLGDGKGNDASEEGVDRSKDFYAAMDFSREIIELRNLERLSQDANATKSWSDLLDLMRCSWFSRRWVIQELALARKATVHCGEKTVPSAFLLSTSTRSVLSSGPPKMTTYSAITETSTR